MYKVILIDLDDTIWDTRTNGRESMREVYHDYRFDRFYPNFDAYYDVYYPNNCALWDQYRQGRITKEELIEERLAFPLRPYMECSREFLIDLNKDFLGRTTLHTELLPHTLETLEYLVTRYPLYIVSNGFEEVQQQKMDNSGLSPYFQGMILSDQVGVNKPHPRIFEEALRVANCRPEEALMLGDSWEADIVGARNAGIDQIWYDLGIEHPSGFEPTYRITSLLELKDLL